MGRIIKPFSMRMAMNSIKANVESYRSQYSEAKATLAGYSNDLTGIKGMTANAMFNQLSCYQSLMDMFILVADNMSDDCDAMIDCIGYEEFIEDDIKDTIKEQENIIKKCDERIDYYENLRRELAPYSVFADHCTQQINYNIVCKEIAGAVIKAMNKKLEKIDEIDSSTKDLFVAEKATLDQISKCIEELKTSGQNGFTLQALPPWATAMQNVLIKKYTDDMLNGDGRLNEDFVKKFADLTIAEMTPAELAAYQKYVEFLMLEAEDTDMNLVIKHSYTSVPFGYGLMPKDSAYELAIVMDAATKTYCMQSPEAIDYRILERNTIMGIALTRTDTYEIGEISMEGGRYKYEYKKYKLSETNHTHPLVSIEWYTTDEVSGDPSLGGDKLGEAKNEYLKNLLRKDASDYIEEILMIAVNVGAIIALPGLTISQEVLSTIAIETFGVLNSLGPAQDEDFGIKSGGICTMAIALDLRTSIVNPGTKEGSLIYNVYPTNETKDRLEFYNAVLEAYDIEPITMPDIYNNPEAVNKKFEMLQAKMDFDIPEGSMFESLEDLIGPTGPYTYESPNEDKQCDNVSYLSKAYDQWKKDNGKN